MVRDGKSRKGSAKAQVAVGRCGFGQKMFAFTYSGCTRRRSRVGNFGLGFEVRGCIADKFRFGLKSDGYVLESRAMLCHGCE